MSSSTIEYGEPRHYCLDNGALEKIRRKLTVMSHKDFIDTATAVQRWAAKGRKVNVFDSLASRSLQDLTKKLEPSLSRLFANVTSNQEISIALLREIIVQDVSTAWQHRIGTSWEACDYVPTIVTKSRVSYCQSFNHDGMTTLKAALTEENANTIITWIRYIGSKADKFSSLAKSASAAKTVGDWKKCKDHTSQSLGRLMDDLKPSIVAQATPVDLAHTLVDTMYNHLMTGRDSRAQKVLRDKIFEE